MRARSLAAVVVVLLLSLAGCGGLPQEGPVTEGLRLDLPISDPIRVPPPVGPASGASQEDIVVGFIQAGQDVDESLVTGRSYLAPSSQTVWRGAEDDIIVYDSIDDLRIRTVAPDTVEVSTPAVARVTPDGRYSDLAPGTRVSARFGMTKVSGEWRIELPPDGFGLWLESGAFDGLYVPRSIHYVTRTGRQLVPDTRWFPNTSRMATALARAQLTPPPAHLAGALTTGVPTGTTLAVNAVPVEGGRAQVNLSQAVLDADPDERAAMWAQFAATLSQVGSVQSVSIAAAGTELDLPGFGATVAVGADLGYKQEAARRFDTALMRRAGKQGQFVRIDPRFVPDIPAGSRRLTSPLRPGDPQAITPAWVRLAMSTGGLEVAAVGGDLRELGRWRDGAFVSVRDFATDLTRPAYDDDGYLWVGGRDPDGRTRLFVAYTGPMVEAVPVAVVAPWLEGRRIAALAVAPDSARLLVVTTDADGESAQLGLAGVIRDPNGAPTGVTEPLRQADGLAEITDVTWIDQDGYAVLGRITAKEPIRPWIGEVGAGLSGMRRRALVSAEEDRLPVLPAGVPKSVTTADEARGIIVVTDRNAVWARAGATWRMIAAGTDVLLPGG